MRTEIENIISNCIDGDKASQFKLYKHLASKLMAVCIRYTKSKMEAEDCLQEAFIKIFKNLGSYNGSGPIEAWARRIAVNTVITYLNKNKILRESLDIEENVDYAHAKVEIQNNLGYEELLGIINLLPDSKKTIFNLYVIEGFNHKEIAEMLNITESTSRAQLSKAKDILVEIHHKLNKTHEERVAS